MWKWKTTSDVGPDCPLYLWRGLSLLHQGVHHAKWPLKMQEFSHLPHLFLCGNAEITDTCHLIHLCRFWLSEAGLHALPSKLSPTTISSPMLTSNNTAIMMNNVSYGPVFTMPLLRHSGHQGNRSFFQNSVTLFSVILTAGDYYNNDSSAACFLKPMLSFNAISPLLFQTTESMSLYWTWLPCNFLFQYKEK